MVAIVLKVAYLGPRFFVPSGLSTLVFGAVSVWLGQSWNQLWILLGLIGFAFLSVPRRSREPKSRRPTGALRATLTSAPLASGFGFPFGSAGGVGDGAQGGGAFD